MSEKTITPEALVTSIKIEARQTGDSLRGAIVEGALLGAEIIAQAAPVDMGILKNSVNSHETAGGAEIVVDAPHAASIEMGTRPHTPPLAPLVEWAKRHKAENPYALARYIQNKISFEGSEPVRYVSGNMRKLDKALQLVVERRLRK